MATNFYEQVIDLLKQILAGLGGGGGGDEPSLPVPVSGYLDVGSSPVGFPDVTLNRGINIKLDIQAIAPVFVGAIAAVGIDEDYQLYPGDSVYLEATNANELGVVSSISSYGTVRVYWLGS